MRSAPAQAASSAAGNGPRRRGPRCVSPVTTTLDRRHAIRAGDDAVAAAHALGRVRAPAAVEVVLPLAAREHVGAVAAVQHRGLDARRELVGARAAEDDLDGLDDVVALALLAVVGLVADRDRELGVTPAVVDGVGAGAAVEAIGAVGGLTLVEAVACRRRRPRLSSPAPPASASSPLPPPSVSSPPAPASRSAPAPPASVSSSAPPFSSSAPSPPLIVSAPSAPSSLSAPAAARERVVAGAAAQVVASAATVQRVVAQAAVERVGTAVARERVGEVGAEHVLEALQLVAAETAVRVERGRHARREVGIDTRQVDAVRDRRVVGGVLAGCRRRADPSRRPGRGRRHRRRRR